MAPRLLRWSAPLFAAALAVLALTGVARADTPAGVPDGPGGQVEVVWSGPAVSATAARAAPRPLVLVAVLAAAAGVAALRSRPLRPWLVPMALAGRPALTPLLRRGPPRPAR
jgi:hypothetical protein